MGALFLKVLEMSLMGSVVILITILARFFLRKRSKTFIMILWAVVALRLIVPFGIESAFSIFNYVPLPTQGIPAQEVSEAALPDTNIDAYQAPVNNAENGYAEAPLINEAAVNNQAPVNVGTPANSANEVSTSGRSTQGVKIMKVDEDSRIVSFAKVVDEDNQGRPETDDAEDSGDNMPEDEIIEEINEEGSEDTEA